MQCYVVAQYLLEIDAGFSDANSILVDVLSLRQSLLATYNDTEEYLIITDFLNLKTGLALTVDEVYFFFAHSLHEFVSCPTCIDGYSIQANDICAACEPGFFSNTTDVPAPNCVQCPPGCTDCYAGFFNQPVCSQCSAGWYLDVIEGTCFECSAACSSCLKYPDFCDACVSPYLHVTYSETNQTCIEDIYCGENCLLCNNT